MDITIVDVPDRNRYEAKDPERLVGVLEYHRRPGVISYDHAEVEPSLRGRGVAGALVLHALRQAQAEGSRVIPRCSYVRDWLDRHPEWHDLVSWPGPGTAGSPTASN